MADHKPLPALPTQSPSLTTLSVDARAHRGRLIRHILAEITDPVVQARQDGWASAFESALDDFSDSIHRGGWLAGIRRGRESKYRPPQSQSTLKEVGRVQSSNAITQSRTLPLVDDHPRIPELLEHLRKHVLQNTVPSPDDKYHLLVCLAPYGARVHFPPTEHGFDIIHANVGCTFTPSKFSLPFDAEHVETTILYGLKEWDNTDTPSPPRIVGGTFAFKGIDSPTHHTSLSQLLRISIYIHLSLLLEQHFLHNSHVHIKFPRPKFTFPSSSAESKSKSKSSNRRTGEEEEEEGEEEEATTGTSSNDQHPSSSPASASSRTNPFLPLSSGSGGILKSFFSRKKNLSHRAQTVNQTGSRGVGGSGGGSSLDLILNPLIGGGSSGRNEDGLLPRSPGTSIDSSTTTTTGTGMGVSRLRRFSFMGVVGGGGGGSSSTGAGHERRPSFRRRPASSERLTPPDSTQQPSPETTDGPFSTALKRVERSKNLLSTSAGVVFFPPSLLVDLATKEVKSPTRRLRGEEKAALGSILGWTGKDTAVAGRGMSGLAGFVRMQGFSFLVTEHVPVRGQGPPPLPQVSAQVQVPPPPPTVPPPAPPAPLPVATTQTTETTTPTNSTLTTTSTSTNTNSNPAEASSLSSSSTPVSCTPCSTALRCGRPQWFTYRYFDFHQQPNGDRRIGEVILDKLASASMPCGTPGCMLKRGEHETRIVHGGFRITITTKDTDGFEIKESKEGEEKVIEMWESCRICEAKTGKNVMNDGTYLFSYAKFLELLIYSSSICVLSPALCEHTTPSPPPPTPPPLGSTSQPQIQTHSHSQPHPPDSRLNIIRHFGVQNATVSFSVSIIEDIFELRVPRLQIHGSSEDERERGIDSNNNNNSGRIEDKGKDVTSNATENDGFGEDKKALRREIKKWWEGVADHMDKLERLLASLNDASDASSIKRLPRLPSVDDAYADFGLEGEGDGEGEGENADERLRTPRAVPFKELPPLGPPPNTPERRFPTGGEEEDDDEVAKTPTRSRINDPIQAPVEVNGDGSVLLINQSGAPLIVAESSEDSRDSTSNPSSFALPATLPTTASTLSISSAVSTTSSTSGTASPTPTPSILTSSTIDDRDPRELLENLRQTFQRAEHELYAQVSRTQENFLNNTRRAFHSAAKGAQKRLAAWQKKHLVVIAKGLKDHGRGSVDEGLLRELGVKDLKELIEMKDPKALMRCEEPEWWAKGCHAVPESSVIVREDDWGSIIAFTLSSSDYHRELANLAINRTAISTPPLTPPAGASSSLRTAPTGPSSFFTTTTGKLFGSSNNDQPDPDRDDVVWHEPEAYSAVISRKEHPRDPTSILSIREVLRHKSLTPDGATMPPTKSGAHDSPQISLASVYAKPDVGVSMEAAGGEVTLVSSSSAGSSSAGAGQDTMESRGADKILHELEGRSRSGTNDSRNVNAGAGCTRPAEAMEGPKSSSTSDAQASTSLVLDQDQLSTATSSYVEAHIKRADAESLLFLASGVAAPRKVDRAPTPPPKDLKGKGKEEMIHDVWTPTAKSLPAIPGEPNTHQPAGSSSSSFAHTIANTLNMAMRLVISQSDLSTAKPLPSTNPPPVPKKQQHHNLLLADLNNIDERPHIKYDWTIGKSVKFSCTVYYARQFDLMRKRCGIDDSFLKSLERSVNWSAEGGKSKSNFKKTLDERFIIKTLVNAWNVADLQVLIELAPSYFRYIESTANRPSVLAKLIGFYTVEIRNLETGAVQSKADLLVMENLFYKRNINRMFDLKGIQGRKVKAKGQGPKTLFDGEWIEGQQRALVLLRPHSKNVLREAIRSDAEFLAKSNIMDYSLLLGIDEEKKLIACGLVDTIGSYTFAKTLEYKAKHNLQSGKNVTVIPPAEYQERFVHTLDDYFVACPDKWSKSLDESKIVSDPFLLPSAL